MSCVLELRSIFSKIRVRYVLIVLTLRSSRRAISETECDSARSRNTSYSRADSSSWGISEPEAPSAT